MSRLMKFTTTAIIFGMLIGLQGLIIHEVKADDNAGETPADESEGPGLSEPEEPKQPEPKPDPVEEKPAEPEPTPDPGKENPAPPAKVDPATPPPVTKDPKPVSKPEKPAVTPPASGNVTTPPKSSNTGSKANPKPSNNAAKEENKTTPAPITRKLENSIISTPKVESHDLVEEDKDVNENEIEVIEEVEDDATETETIEPETETNQEEEIESTVEASAVKASLEGKVEESSKPKLSLMFAIGSLIMFVFITGILVFRRFKTN